MTDTTRNQFHAFMIKRWPGINMEIRSDGSYWEHRDDSREIWQAATEQGKPPAGYQLVPIEPTMEMQENGSIASDYDLSQERAKAVFQAMLGADKVQQMRPTKPPQTY